MDKAEILIVGNPNTGKTTLFNNIAKCNEKVANYSGVTVKETKKQISFCNCRMDIVDLPGLYSTHSMGMDESVTKSYIEKHKDAKIVYVVSTADIEKNLHLFVELITAGYDLSLFVNEKDAKLEADSIKILKERLGMPIYYGDARKKRKDILKWLVNQVLQSTRLGGVGIGYDEIVKLLKIVKIESQKLDKLFLHPFVGKVLFFVIIGLIYYASFLSVGGWLSGKVYGCWEVLCEYLISIIAKYDRYLLIDFIQVAVLKGLGSVISFLPQLFIMLFCMYVLEESGYLPRVSYLFNIDLNELGLNGKSVFGVSVGMGCTTSGILATRNIENKRCRKQTCLLLPFVGCSAKLPILLYLSANLLVDMGHIMILIIVLVLYIAMVYMRTIRGEGREYFIIEIPRLRMPDVKTLLKQSTTLIKDFLKRVVGTILLVTTVVWLCMNIYVEAMGQTLTIIDLFTKIVGVFFAPIGLNNKAVVMSVITGIIAKENIISTMALYGEGVVFGVVPTITFIIFIMLYSPCLPALRCAGAEFGRKFALRLFVVQMLFAYGVSFVFYTFGAMFGVVLGFVFCIVFISLAMATIKIFSKSCKINCVKCFSKA